MRGPGTPRAAGPGTPGFIPTDAHNMAPITPLPGAIRAPGPGTPGSGVPGTPGFMPIPSGNVAPVTPMPAALRPPAATTPGGRSSDGGPGGSQPPSASVAQSPQAGQQPDTASLMGPAISPKPSPQPGSASLAGLAISPNPSHQPGSASLAGPAISPNPSHQPPSASGAFAAVSPLPQPTSASRAGVVSPQPPGVTEGVDADDHVLEHPVPSVPSVPSALSEGGAASHSVHEPPTTTPEQPVPSVPSSTPTTTMRPKTGSYNEADEQRDLDVQHPVPSLGSSAYPTETAEPTADPTADPSIPSTNTAGNPRAHSWAVELPVHEVVLPTESAATEPRTQEALTGSMGLCQPEPSPEDPVSVPSSTPGAKRRRLHPESEADAPMMAGDETPTIGQAPPTVVSGSPDGGEK